MDASLRASVASATNLSTSSFAVSGVSTAAAAARFRSSPPGGDGTFGGTEASALRLSASTSFGRPASLAATTEMSRTAVG